MAGAKEKDRAAFDNAEASNGFDAWRRIVVPMARLHQMHKDVTRPPASRHLADYEADLDRWENDLEEYYKRGGDKCLTGPSY